MEAFVFDISLPTNWSQLTDRQLTFLFAQLGKNRPAYDTETRCLLKWAQLIVIDQLPDGSFLVRKKRKHFYNRKPKPVLLTAHQIFNATRFLSFIKICRRSQSD